MKITITPNSLVVFIGAMGTGKSTFARTHFAPHHVVSSDFIREQLTGDFEEQAQNTATFEILYATVEARAKAGLLTIVDSTGTQEVLDRVKKIAHTHGRDLLAIQFPALDESELTHERMKHRMRYLHAYHKQVDRIAKTVVPKEYRHYQLPKDLSVTIEKIGKSSVYDLDPNFEYVIVPDLHGEVYILEHAVKNLKENQKIVVLGDIVDRGESSYRTFTLVNDLIHAGKAVAVRGNHDNKLMRYFVKWLDDDQFGKCIAGVSIPNYGMKIAHGLEKTLTEFYGMRNAAAMEKYAKDFVSYYRSITEYLRLEKNGELHFFAHAGVNQNMLLGFPMKPSDEQHAIYNSLRDVEYLDTICEQIEQPVSIHLGHDVLADTINFIYGTNRKNRIVKHDVGYGKRERVEEPVFMVV